MAIDAGTIMAYLDLDTSGFGSALQTAQSQAIGFARDGGGISSTLDGIGVGMANVGSALTLGVTTPLVGVGTAMAKASIGWESAFADVRKTVNITSGDVEAGYQRIADGLTAMSEEIPVSAEGLAGIAANAGQLGVAEEYILSFTRVMADLEVATNLSGEEAAAMFAQYANITGMDMNQISNLGSTIVELGNNTATTERDIAEMMHRLAGAGSIVGLTDAQIAGISATLTSLGINAEAGGSAMSRVLADMNSAVIGGGKELKGFASIAGTSSAEFAKAWKADPVSALQMFTEGLNAISLAGGDVDAALEAVGLNDIRITDMLKRLMGSGELLTDTVDMANDAWLKNTALSEEAAQRYATVASKINMLKNGVGNLARKFGDVLLPIISKCVDWLMKGVQWLSGLDDGMKKAIMTVGGVAAAIGPALLVGGKLLSAFSPIVPLVAAVGGGLALIYKHSERVRDIVDKLRTGGLGAFDGLKAGVSQYSELMAGGASRTEALGKALETAFGVKASGQITGMLGKLSTGLNGVGKAVSGTLAGVGEFAGSLIDGQGVAQSLEDALQAAFGGKVPESVRALQAGIGGLVTQIKDDFTAGGVLGVLRGLGGTIADGLEVAQAKLAPKAQALMTALGTSLANAREYAVEHLPIVREAIMNGLGVAKDKMTGVAKNAMTWLGNAYRSGGVQKALGNLAGVGKTVLGKLSAGKDALWDKAGEMLSWLGEALGSSDVLDKLGELSGVAAGIAGKIASGMGSWRGTASELIGGLVTQLTDNGFLRTALEGLGAVAVAIGEGICTAAVNMADAAATLLSRLAEALTQPGLLDGLLTDASTIVVGVGNAIISAAGKIIPAATTLISTLVNKLSESGFVTTLFTTASTVVTAIGGQIAKAAPDIVGCATDLITSLVGKLTETNFVSDLFTTASLVVTEIGGQIAAAAPSIVGCATDLIASLTGKLTETNFVSDLFTTAGKVVVEIANAIGDNAGSIISCASDLVEQLILGLNYFLETVDWEGVGTALKNALAQVPWDEVALSACGLLGSALKSALELVFGNETAEVILPEANVQWFFDQAKMRRDVSDAFQEGLDGLQPEKVTIDAGDSVTVDSASVTDSLGMMFGRINSSISDEGEKAKQRMALAVGTMAQGFWDEVNIVQPQLYDSASSILLAIRNATKAEDIISAFGTMGFQISGSLAQAILDGSVSVENAAFLLMSGLDQSLIEGTANSEVQGYLQSFFSDTSTQVSTLLQNSATDWGKIFGRAIPDGATVGLENGMYLLRAATGEVIKEVSAVDAEATVKAGNKGTAEAGMDALKGGIEDKESGVTTAAETAVDNVTEPFGSMPETSKTDSEAMMTAVKLAIEEGTPAATAAITVAAQAVVDTAKGIMSEGSGKGIGRDYITAIGSGIGSMRVQLTYKARELAQAGVGAVSAVMSWSAGYSIGTQMVSSIVSGVGAMASALNARMRALALGAVGAFRAALQMHSPSRVLVADGMMIPTSIGLGVERNADEATRSMIDLARDMADAWPDGPDGWDVDGFGGGHGGGGAGGASGQGGLVVNNNGPITIREEADIERVAGVLYEMYLEERRGG